jgi:hypothetical protein
MSYSVVSVHGVGQVERAFIRKSSFQSQTTVWGYRKRGEDEGVKKQGGKITKKKSQN